MDIVIIGGAGRTGFDWEDTDTWRPALEGADAAYVCFTPDLAFPGVPEKMAALGRLAHDAGLRRLVLLSGRGEEGARTSEAALREGGVPTTVLGAYPRNVDTGCDYAASCSIAVWAAS